MKKWPGSPVETLRITDVGEFKDICPMAWPACKRNWQERKKERCVVSCDWNEEGCVVEGWRELAYFLTSYLTRVWWCLKTSMEATNSELHVMKCLRLHQDGLWTPTVSSQCSVDVLIMGLSCIFWKKKKEERRRRRRKFFFFWCTFISFCFLGDLTWALWLIVLLWTFTAKCRCDLA